MSDAINVNELSGNLRTEIFGKNDIIYLPQTDSTNTQAYLLAKQGLAHGSVLIADSQTKGRGQKSRVWHSPRGTGVYLSVVLYPELNDKINLLTLTVGTAAAEALNELNINAGIKWPNDILLSSKKAGGILCESHIENGRIIVIAGIGINVNLEKKDLPPELEQIATSILAETGKSYARETIIQSLIEKLELYYNLHQNKKYNSILETWKKHCVIFNRMVSADLPHGLVKGIAFDIDDEGNLLIDDSGKTHKISVGEISFVVK